MSGEFRAETEDFVTAARLLHDRAAQPLSRILGTTVDALSGSGSMAGSDPGGQAWAAAYDRAAHVALKAHVDAVNASYRVSTLCTQSARNYAQADLASFSPHADREAVTAAVRSAPVPTELSFSPAVPSAAGGSGGGPPGWSLVESLVNRVWPNGHQDRLTAASHAWRACGAITNDSALEANMASVGFGIDRLPEFSDIVDVCSALASAFEDLSDVHRGIGASCTQLATHIDKAHSAIEHELGGLAGQSAAIEGAGALLSLATFGAAEVPTQAVEAARIRAAAQRITELIDMFVQAAREVAATMSTHAQNAARVWGDLRGFLGMMTQGAPVTPTRPPRNNELANGLYALRRMERNGGLPPLIITRTQAEKKYKHAADFGVHLPKGKAGFEALEKAMPAYVLAPGTTRKSGRYRNQPAIFNYDSHSNIVVVQHPGSGKFWFLYEMGAEQRDNVDKRGVLSWMK